MILPLRILNMAGWETRRRLLDRRPLCRRVRDCSRSTRRFGGGGSPLLERYAVLSIAWGQEISHAHFPL